MACYLNCMARPVLSASGIWDAKRASFDNETLVGARYCVAHGDVEATLASLARSPNHDEAHAYLTEMRDRGELANLDTWLANTRESLRAIARENLEA